MVGVYFKTNETPMPIIGTTSSESHAVCKKQGSLDNTVSINCSSSLIETNLVIHAEAQISELL